MIVNIWLRGFLKVLFANFEINIEKHQYEMAAKFICMKLRNFMLVKYAGHKIDSRFRLQIRQVVTLTQRVNFEFKEEIAKRIFVAACSDWWQIQKLSFLIVNLSN